VSDIIAMLRPEQRAAEEIAEANGAIHRDLYRWLRDLATAVNFGVVPPKGIIHCNLSVDDVAEFFDDTGLGVRSDKYGGFAICNGNNGTPDLTGFFVMGDVSGIGATGGSASSAHTHAIDHDHGSFTSGTEAAHTHTTPAHQHQTDIGWDGTALYMRAVSGADSDPYSGSTVVSDDRLALVHGSANTVNNGRYALTQSDGGGTSGAGSSHSHSVDVPALTGDSGAASVTENRPPFVGLVPLMRLP
jgi:hypothetical protein